MIAWNSEPSSNNTRVNRFVSEFNAYWKQTVRRSRYLPSSCIDTSGLDYCYDILCGQCTREVLSNPLQVALLKKRAALAAKKAEVIDRRGKKSPTETCSRKSRLQTALISLQNGLVRSQYLLAAKVQACAGPQSV